MAVHLLDRLHDQRQQIDHDSHEQERDLLPLLDPEPDDGQGDEGRDRQEAHGIEHGGEEELDRGKGAHQEPERDGHEGGQHEAHGHAVEAPAGAADERLLEVQSGKGLQDLGGRGQDDRGHDARVAERAPEAEEHHHPGHDQAARPLVADRLPDLHED